MLKTGERMVAVPDCFGVITAVSNEAPDAHIRQWDCTVLWGDHSVRRRDQISVVEGASLNEVACTIAQYYGEQGILIALPWECSADGAISAQASPI